MRNRVNEEEGGDYEDLNKELMRLTEKYWTEISPKKNEQKYEEFAEIVQRSEAKSNKNE